MNNFNLCGRVVKVGQKRADRAPWPVEIETEIGRDKTVIVPVEIFRPEPPPVGWVAVLSGVLDSREWQGRRYLQLVVKSHEFLPPPAPAAAATVPAAAAALFRSRPTAAPEQSAATNAAGKLSAGR